MVRNFVREAVFSSALNECSQTCKAIKSADSGGRDGVRKGSRRDYVSGTSPGGVGIYKKKESFFDGRESNNYHNDTSEIVLYINITRTCVQL